MTGGEHREPLLSAEILRDEAALIVQVDGAIGDVLGWGPEDLLGRPSTEFIHPEDQPSAIAAWFAMLEAPGIERTWQGRYRTSAGTWRWVECVNVNRLDNPETPYVFSRMTPIAVDRVSIEDELRERKQMLNRLADALPVGVFQLERDGTMTFTNDRFLAIVNSELTATTTAQFAGIADDDRGSLAHALADVLQGKPVDDIEIRFGEDANARVCILAMRPLTDQAGAVSGAVGCLSDITERVRLRDQLEIQATIDPLTDCLNRSATLIAVESMLAAAVDQHTGSALLFIDLDDFKHVNDVHGHAAGDQLLEVCAQRMRLGLRANDRLGRIGGDEFLAICPDVANTGVALQIANRLTESLTHDVELGELTLTVRASIGVAWSATTTDADELIANADLAMYQAKRSPARERVALTVG